MHKFDGLQSNEGCEPIFRRLGSNTEALVDFRDYAEPAVGLLERPLS